MILRGLSRGFRGNYDMSVLQNVVENAHHLSGLGYVGFGLSFVPGLAGLAFLIRGVYFAVKPTYGTNAGDLTGAAQGVRSVLSLLGGAALVGFSYFLLTTFFGG